MDGQDVQDGVGGDGAEGQTRTVDTGIFSAVLYHLSYLGRDTNITAAVGGCQGYDSNMDGQDGQDVGAAPPS